MWPTCSRIMLRSTAKRAKLPFSSHRVILHRSNRLATGSSPMARVGANLLCVVIYGPFSRYTPDAAYSTPDPAYRETGGYISGSFRGSHLLSWFCVLSVAAVRARFCSHLHRDLTTAESWGSGSLSEASPYNRRRRRGRAGSSALDTEARFP